MGKIYKTTILSLILSGVFLMVTASPPKARYANMRSETNKECRSLTGACGQREVKKVKKSNEYKKLQKLVRTRHW
jgi:hypothetical protein